MTSFRDADIRAEDDGLNVSDTDSITQDELETLRAYHTRLKGRSMDYVEFWAEFRPDVLKRFRGSLRESTVLGEMPALPHLAAMLHHYTIVGWNEAIPYQIQAAREGGATRAEVLDILAIAFIHAGPWGMKTTAGAPAAYLRAWDEPPPKDRWPQNWSFDPKAFSSGIDFSTPDTTEKEIKTLLDWYQATLGEIPRHVQFLAHHRPRLLKAYRNRFEHAIRDALPKELLPYLLLHYAVSRGFRDGIREAVLLGKALSMSRSHLLDAIAWGMLYGGVDSINIVDEAAGDVLSSLD